jgi:hypothetical protein
MAADRGILGIDPHFPLFGGKMSLAVLSMSFSHVLAVFLVISSAVGQPKNRDPYFTPTGAKTTSFMPRVIIRNIREDRAGNIWFATFAGPIRYDGKEFRNFSEEVGLPKTRIFSLLEARSGALWFGSITGGASRYDGKSFTKFTDKDGLGNNDVTWIFEDRDASIWFGTGNGVTRYDGKVMTNFTTKDGLVHNSVYAIEQDASGRIWFGTQGGICSYDGKSLSNLADTVGRTFVNIRAIVVDRSGDIWFGGQGGAFRYDGKTLTPFTSKEGLLDDFVGSMIVDRAGNVWMGHPSQHPSGRGGGASRFDGKSFTHFTQKDGLGSETVYCMLEDKAGRIWFGSVDAGACRYDGKTFTLFSATSPPLPPTHGGSPGLTKTAKVADAMASFARMLPGEWRVKFPSGTNQFDTWKWGPGQHSMRMMTDGSDAVGNRWCALEVVYWHPGRKQARLLGIHPDVPGVGRGVSEGTFKFEGETAEAIIDLYQPRGRRNIARRWVFDGLDRYHATLLEATGRDRYVPLTEWDYARSKTPTPARPRTALETSKPSERLKALEPLLGRTWEAKGNWATGDALHAQTTFEWVPLLDAIYASVVAPSKDGKPTHVLDAYFYHHLGVNRLRCLALSNRGGVYEGDLTVLSGGLQLDLKGYEGDRVIAQVVQFEFEKGGTLRNRVWNVNGAERSLMLDIHQRKLTPKKD